MSWRYVRAVVFARSSLDSTDPSVPPNQNAASFGTNAWPHAVHVVSHLATYDLGTARAVADRSPPASLGPAAALLEAVERPDFVRFWGALAELGTEWPDTYAGLLHRVASVVRFAAFKTTCRSFSAVDPTKFAALMGLTAEDAVEFATQHGATTTASGMLKLPTGVMDDGRLTESELEAVQRLLVAGASS